MRSQLTDVHSTLKTGANTSIASAGSKSVTFSKSALISYSISFISVDFPRRLKGVKRLAQFDHAASLESGGDLARCCYPNEYFHSLLATANMSDDEAARDRLKKRLPLILITAAGTALFITGRTAKYLFKKVQTPDSSSSSTASPLKLRLRDLSPQKNKAYFLNNKTILSQSPAVMPDKQESFWAFVRGDANKEPLPPPIPGDNFDPVFFTAKAFGIATALVLGTFGAAGWWIAKAMDVHDVRSLRPSFDS